MIDVYFVRHGETVANVAKRNQPDHTVLTHQGEIQAAAAGTTLATYEPTHFFTSSHVRAVETARMIARSLSLIPERSELLVELKRPHHTHGYTYFSWKTMWYLLNWYIRDSRRDAEGESYVMLRQRLTDTRELYTALPDNSRVVAVSHSVFITLFIAHMNHPERMSLFAAVRFLRRIFTIKNGSITHVTYNPKTEEWRLVR